MILVLNPQRRSSGNNAFLLLITAILFLGSCGPKKQVVLRAPDHKKEVERVDEKKTDKEDIEEEDVRDLKYERSSIALVLPFQLDQISFGQPVGEDVKRSALALDFYQGFQLGLNEFAKDGGNFELNVIDSKDNEIYNATLAQSDNVKEALLVVGPVYPKEIKSFGQNLADKNILQINPLAATLPSEFMLPNLVSLTPSIRSHSIAIAKMAAKNYREHDIIFIINSSDADTKQFLNEMEQLIKNERQNAIIRTVSSIEQTEEFLTHEGVNYIISGTTNRFEISSLINWIDYQSMEMEFRFKIFGHPLWERFDFSNFDRFASYSPIITTENHLQKSSNETRRFNEQYHKSYGVAPSDHSYKGYDAAQYFGKLIKMYGSDYQDKVSKTVFDGVFSSYRFEYNPSWGYVNEAVSYRIFDGNEFRLK